MKEFETHTLWSALTGRRYFLVPDEVPIVEPMPNAPVPDGMFELCTISGRRRLVREEEVRPYQVSQDRAVEWLQIELAPAIQELKDAAMANAERMLDEEAERQQAESKASIPKVKKSSASRGHTSPKPARRRASHDTKD